MARGDWVKASGTNTKNPNSCVSTGLYYRYANTIENAIETNKSLIDLLVWVVKSNNSTTYRWTNDNSYIKYDNSEATKEIIATRWDNNDAVNGREYYLTASYPYRTTSALTSTNLPNGTTGSAYIKRIEITHNSDGTRVLPVEWYFKGGNVYFDYSKFEASIILDTIPRQTKCPSVAGIIGLQTSVILSPNNPNYTHTLSYVVEGTTYTVATKTSLTTIPISLSDALYQKIANKKYNAVMTLKTYSGDTQVGTNETGVLEINCSETNARPTINSNSTTVVDADGRNKIIRYNSTVLVTVQAIIRKYATFTSLTIGGQSVTPTQTDNEDGTTTISATKEIPNFSNTTIPIVLTDSRTYSNESFVFQSSDSTANHYFEMINYIPLSIGIDSCERVDSASNSIKVKFSGNYYNGNLGSGNNTLSLVWKYKLKTAEIYTNGGTLTLNTDYKIINNTFISGSGSTPTEITINDVFLYTDNYDFQIIATDSLDSQTARRDVIKGTPVADWGDDDWQFNVDLKLSSGNSVLDYTIVDNW